VAATRVSEAQARLDLAGRALRDEQKIALELPGTKVPAGRTLFDGEDLQVRYGQRTVFAEGGVQLSIRGPERIALTGANGVGKSTLLRILNGEVEPEGGVIKRAEGRVAYLSQRLDLLDAERTVAQNLAAFAPAMPEAQRMNLLARFLFRGSRIHLPVGVLSGGERLRATLACVLFAEPARSCFCWTSRPTTSTSSALASWKMRSTPTRARSWWSATTSGSWPRSGWNAGWGCAVAGFASPGPSRSGAGSG
jgi:ATPase subunit of ABC transporter with duplicated ATPase domains